MCIDSGARTKKIRAFPAAPPIQWGLGEGSHSNRGIIFPAAGAVIMRYRVIALFSVVLSVLAPCGLAAAQDSPKNDIKGLFLLTDYPAVSVRPGTTSTVNLRLQNYDLPPERLALSVAGAPAGWTATLIGGGPPGAGVNAGNQFHVH